MKKLSAILITLVLLISCCIIGAMPASAAELDIKYEDFDIMDGVILEYLGSDSEVIVPAIDAEGNPITRIDSRAFRENKTLEKVYICEGITEIGSEAFEYCVNLTEVSLPYSLEKVEYSLLRKCSIASLVIPGNLKEIPQGIILNATMDEGGLGIEFTDIVISPGVEKILTRSLYFEGDELVVPDTVFLIEGAAWRYAKKEVAVYICNPDCVIGTLSVDQDFYYPGTREPHKFSGDAPIVIQWDNDNLTKIYSSKDATPIKDKVNQWNTTYGGGFVFIGQDQAKMDDLNKKCADNGTVAPTKWNHNPDDENPSNGATGNNNNNGNGNNVGTGNNNAAGLTSTTIIILAVIVLVIVIIIAVVIIVVVMANKNNKKKKKKKKVKVKKEETTAEEPIESTEDIE